ncbi:hypothetical protein A2673_03480 [Candidatus Kaiserbacteria bacterium RIFCSPHIGHO2_01_FULL_50_13]|uniref:Transglycosylase SLT domain-containing protein n=1 Tax=Candidatus Kaiserbacteria bacterium RIFCSPLOWO2_01_FULL_50_24 TaxID=1798507 RepID=A0A1F6EMM7_9BACT|nr:MAG: hypothetical protein A2673_03480 [Candidatus Kaiserbacteria bacterium RIFCSPHIGHO2_01_FULL_50_13]OGG74889.1 MAG: hypothetical protein A3A34_03660 [Candidatus Kaiserbacteria bacterium RIFCSPLOWO2_01_FULL_50_24]OGG81626.1 MAG: hypothetical protein A3H74_01440 [Candidatus Kaiserbacteria bacterium RIFCSPLOWO2_02_FULL_51_13]
MTRSYVLSAFVLFVVFATAVFAFAETPEERRTRLEQELAKIEQDIVEKRGVLSEKQKERTSLERDIAVLDYQIEIAKTQIRHRDLAIARLRDEIGNKQSAIYELDKKVGRSEASLAQLIRRTRELDDRSLAEIILSDSLSRVFAELDALAQVEQELNASFEIMASLRSDLAARKTVLEGEQGEEEQLRRIQLLEKQTIERKEKEKQQILTVTRGEEKTYQQLIVEREKQAAVIRSALFELRDSAAIPFGKAYDFAKEASAKTGVRPALILAVLRQETNLGENVGQCFLTNSPNKGDGQGKNTGRYFARVMKPDRDVDPFLEIMSGLGLDPFGQVVSCPPGYGYGGAMGPAQFIPSTWMLYKDRLARVVGQNPPNPWDARTAIFASTMLLMDNGADKGTYASERLATLRYFAGWTNAQKAAYAFYGDSVMSFAAQYQKDIDILEGK